jgi:hypothetical protein
MTIHRKRKANINHRLGNLIRGENLIVGRFTICTLHLINDIMVITPSRIKSMRCFTYDGNEKCVKNTIGNFEGNRTLIRSRTN